MYIEQWTYYRVRKQSVCNNTHSVVVQNNLHAKGTKFSIQVHRAVKTSQGIREQSVCNNAHSEGVQNNLHAEGTKFSIDQWTYYRVREQSVCNIAHSEVVQNNLQAEGNKFSIHVHRAVDILQGKRTISV